MTIERKLLGTSPSGGATDVAEVFSTYLYTGTGGAQSINNGIDLAGEGGLVWIKSREQAKSSLLVDTERGSTTAASNHLSSDATTASTATANEFVGFTSTGFNLVGNTQLGLTNNGSRDHVSWTFRKKKKFFDVVTWSGNGVAGRTVAHGLDGPVGMILTKRTDASFKWPVYHRGIGATKYLQLNDAAAAVTYGGYSNSTEPTDSVFSVGDSNVSGGTYVAYLFADNSSEDAEDQMIKCGSYTGTGASVGASVTLGWEPQFVLIKAASAGGSWAMMDTMRGIPNDADNPTLFANTNAAEVAQANWLEINSTGFKTLNGNYGNGNASGVTYIYMAIRAPMMVEPEAATDVFTVSTEAAFSSDRLVSAGFAVDAAISAQTGSSGAPHMTNRLTAGTWLSPDEDSAQGTGNYWLYDESLGVKGTNAQYGSVTTVWNMWKRAKGYMDVVAYSGSGSATTVAHSLGVAPEMIWLKQRGQAENWQVYNSASGNTKAMRLNMSVASYTSTSFNNTTPTNTVFSVDNSNAVNGSGRTYMAYLFATLAGISKCGSYTGNGSSQTISCGFSAGARFILIKRTDATGDWYYWDSARGIVAGNDPHLSLNNYTAQVTNDDSVDPHNSGFIVNQVSATNINVSSATYIFYAIA